MFFIHKSEVPEDRFKDVTYGKINCDFKETKEEKNRTRLTVGGDRINYPGDCGTPTSDLLSVKLLLNSVVSTAGAELMTLDIKNFYLCTPLERYGYLRMKISNFPQDVIDLYKLQEKATADGFVHVEVRRGMYGLPKQAY